MNPHHYDTSKIFGFLESLRQESTRKSRFKATFFLFHSSASPIKVFEKNKHFEIKKDGDIPTCHFRPVFSHDLRKEKKQIMPGGDFYLFSLEENLGIWAICSLQEGEFNEKRINRFFSYWRCPFTKSFLSSADIGKILINLRVKRLNSEVRSIRSVAYSRHKKATINFDDYEISELLDQINVSNSYLSSIAFNLIVDNKQVLKARINRSGDLVYNEGDINLFFDCCIVQAANILRNKVVLLSNKNRKKYSDNVHPIQIKYGNDVFADKRANQKMVEALSSIKRTTFTVYHANPYFHGSLLDFKDGSSFDVYITSSKTISLIPSFQASAAAFSRVISNIFETIEEGVILEEPLRKSIAFDDLVASTNV